MKKIPFYFNGDTLSLVLDGESYHITKSHHNWDTIKKALKANDTVSLDLLVNSEPPAPFVAFNYSIPDCDVYISDNEVLRDGEPVEGAFAEYVWNLHDQDLPLDGALKFIDRLYKSESFSTFNSLLGYMSANDLTIDSEGFIIAYKAVRSNFMDKYSNSISNMVGRVVEMERRLIDDNRDSHCSRGLHAGTLDYITWYGATGDKIVIVKIDPADVVSVPKDHSCQKLRTCKYEVVGLFEGELKSRVYNSEMTTSEMYDYDDSLYYDDDDDEFDDW